VSVNYQDWQTYQVEADKRMKAGNGHRFVTILKTRCEFCGKRPTVKTRCGGWFQSYLSHLADVLLEHGVIAKQSAASQ
jgi:hypothetical protein